MAGTWNFNTFHNDKWQCNFSNLPSITDLSLMKYYDNFVKSVVIPDYNLEEIYSDFQSFRIRHPAAPQINKNLSQIQVEFKMSEDMLNYIYLWEWMRRIKYAEDIDLGTDEFFRKYTIKAIAINILDNQKREVAVWRFTQCFLLTLSSVSLLAGSSEEVSFTGNFSYEEVKYERKSIIST